jgi:LytS/YehU family sensor histidine kinase
MKAVIVDDETSGRNALKMLLDPQVTEVPPMIIQPFVENAIWHGLLRKEGERKLKVEFLKTDDKLVCAIEDNGVGRGFQQPLMNSQKENYTSRGNKLVSDRLDALNTLHNINGKMRVIDLVDENKQPSGTRVEIEVGMG